MFYLQKRQREAVVHFPFDLFNKHLSNLMALSPRHESPGVCLEGVYSSKDCGGPSTGQVVPWTEQCLGVTFQSHCGLGAPGQVTSPLCT